jgi:hypothetical protein
MTDRTALLLAIYRILEETYPLGRVVPKKLPLGKLGRAILDYEAAIQTIFDEIGAALNIPEE